MLAVDDRHVAFCEYNGSVARIICVAVATLANKKLLERASDNDLLLCRSQLRIKRVIDNDLINIHLYNIQNDFKAGQIDYFR